jgi:heat shock protein HslJ
VAGCVGVNRFTGSFTVDGDVLQVGPVASTRMAGPPEMMTLENRFNSAF